MGDMADFTTDDFFDDEEDPRSETPEGMWRQRDGTLIAIRDMTDTHLNNAINLCQRRGMEWLSYDLKEEQNRRQDIRVKADAARFPEMKAFIAGWNAGYKASDQVANPEVGPGPSKINMLDEWAAFKIRRDRERKGK